ncbi:unnamed protein product [Ectocarpus sp. 4 AP-2014]
MKRGQEILVGVGDSSFCQIPCPWASWSCQTADEKSKSHRSSSNDDVRRVQTNKISQIACGATTCLAAVNNNNNNKNNNNSNGSSAIDLAPPAYLLEWGTGLYGERLSMEASVPQQGDERKPPSFLNHPAQVAFSSLPLGLHSSPPAIRYIVCGAHFVVASLENGGCISWGGGREGRRALGRGSCGTCGQCRNGSTPAAPPLSYPSSSKPDWVAEPLGLGGSKVAELAAGDDHVIAVGTDGSAWAWGRGDCGQLGYGSPDGADRDGGGSACMPMAVQLPSPASGTPRDEGGLANTSSGAAGAATGVESGHGVQDPRKRPGALVVRAACGRDHSAIVTNDGRIWTFGSGLHGQLGLGTVGETSSIPTVVDALIGVGTMRPDGSFTGMETVACGAWHTAALSTTGDVYTWGWARFGALGPSPFVAGSPRRPQQDTTACATGDSATINDRVASPARGKRKLETTSSTPAAEEGEVRPYPGLVDGMDDILADDDDQLVSVSCGARYTLTTSSKGRAFVWGQVAPSLQHYSRRGGGEQKGGDGSSVRGTDTGDGKGPPLGSFSVPREMNPAELLQDAAPPNSQMDEGGEGRCCCEVGSPKGVRAGADDKGDSRWKVSTVGCGPWFVVFGLQEEDRLG